MHERKPSDLPEGVWEDVVINNPSQMIIDYYMGDKHQFTFTQTVLKPNDKYVDNEDIDISYIKINGNEATVVVNTVNKEIDILWNDSQYSYQIFSAGCDLDTLLQYAESVK